MAVTTCDCPNPTCEATPHKGRVRCTTPKPPMWGGSAPFVESSPETWADPKAWARIAEGLECPACDHANPSQRIEVQTTQEQAGVTPASVQSKEAERH
jgi:hypothetical protein